MQVERRENTGPRQVLIGMVVSRAVLGPIAARWEEGLFGSRWENLLAGWCVKHYRRYNKPPGKDIEEYFDRWAERNADRDVIEAMSSFLSGLSQEYAELKKRANPEYLLDVANRLFRRTKQDDLRNKLEATLERGDIEAGDELIAGYRRVEVGVGTGVSPLSDKEAIISAFEGQGETLVEYDGALKDFFKGMLVRDALVAFMGKEKVGKSFWLMDLVYRAVTQKHNVAYLEVGDMTQGQVLRRFASRVIGEPVKEDTTVRMPVTMEGGNPPEVQRSVTHYAIGMHPEDAHKALFKLGEEVGHDRLRLSCHLNQSITVAGLEAVVEGWVRNDNWVPDVIVLDYADILAPPVGYQDNPIEAINQTWMGLRRMNQRYHCCLVTATQIKAAGYNARTLSRKDFGGNHLKLAHVTGMVGINRTDAEKRDELYRLNWVVGRDLDFPEDQCVWTASCLAVGQPAVLSLF